MVRTFSRSGTSSSRGNSISPTTKITEIGNSAEPIQTTQAEIKDEVAIVTELEPIVAQTSLETVTEPLSEMEAREYIFMRESTNRLDAINSIGCIGLGQDCNGQLEIDCPDWRTNRDCQTAFFDRYVLNRYGSWANAYNFWLGHNWY